MIAVAMGGTTGTQRGIFRTDDGGHTWTNVLHPDNETGGRDLSSPFDMPNVIFATTIAETPAVPAGRGGEAAGNAPQPHQVVQIRRRGQDVDGSHSNPSTTGRIAVAVAMHSNGQRIYVVGGSAAECVRTFPF